LSTQLLTELLSVMSATTSTLVTEQDGGSAGRVAVELTAQFLEAEVAAVVASDGTVPISTGFPSGRIPFEQIVDAVANRRPTINLPGANAIYYTAVVPMSGRRPGHLLVARARERFDDEEHSLLRGAALVLDLTFGATDATHDPLTGLAARTAFRERITRDLALARPDRHLALLYLDLDGFKSINDAYGHAEGDRLLVWFADRLRSCLRPTDAAARLGGDEFAVEILGVAPAEAIVVAARVVERTRAPFVLTDGGEVTVGASIGIAVSGDSSDTPDELIRRADHAMYRAKRDRLGYYLAG
jgi:diguanylate cyclase (GGDEF)-like protein